MYYQKNTKIKQTKQIIIIRKSNNSTLNICNDLNFISISFDISPLRNGCRQTTSNSNKKVDEGRALNAFNIL